MSTKISALFFAVLAAYAASEEACSAGASCPSRNSIDREAIDTEATSASLNLLQVRLSVEGKDDSKGFPDLGDIFKEVQAAMGGAEELEKDLEGVGAAAKAFFKSVGSDVKSLVSSVDTSMSINDVRSKVKHFFEQVQKAAKKLEDAMKKVSNAWKNGVGKIAPKAISDGMTSILNKVIDQAKAFTDSFKHAAEELKKVDVKALCAKVKHSLEAVIRKANELDMIAALLKHPPKELENGLKALPSAVKDQVDKVMKKAEHAADHILDKITKSMKEIANGVSKAFDGRCQDSASAQLGARSVVVLVLGMLALFM